MITNQAVCIRSYKSCLGLACATKYVRKNWVMYVSISMLGVYLSVCALEPCGEWDASRGKGSGWFRGSVHSCDLT